MPRSTSLLAILLLPLLTTSIPHIPTLHPCPPLYGPPAVSSTLAGAFTLSPTPLNHTHVYPDPYYHPNPPSSSPPNYYISAFGWANLIFSANSDEAASFSLLSGVLAFSGYEDQGHCGFFGWDPQAWDEPDRFGYYLGKGFTCLPPDVYSLAPGVTFQESQICNGEKGEWAKVLTPVVDGVVGTSVFHAFRLKGFQMMDYCNGFPLCETNQNHPASFFLEVNPIQA